MIRKSFDEFVVCYNHAQNARAHEFRELALKVRELEEQLDERRIHNPFQVSQSREAPPKSNWDLVFWACLIGFAVGILAAISIPLSLSVLAYGIVLGELQILRELRNHAGR